MLSTIFELIPQSNFANNSVNWTVSTGEVVVSANQTIPLNESQFAIVIVEEDYSSAGIYKANASINSSNRNDFEKGVVVISP